MGVGLLLVHRDVAVETEEMLEAKGGELQHPRGLARVEHVDDVEPEVALEPHNVHVGAVQHLDTRVCSGLAFMGCGGLLRGSFGVIGLVIMVY